VRDGINLAKMNIPAVALVTEAFWPQGDFVAASLGMPDIPRIQLPHPVAGSGEANMRAVAASIVEQVINALENAVE